MPSMPSATTSEDDDPGSRYVLMMWNSNSWLTVVWANSGRLCAISRFQSSLFHCSLFQFSFYCYHSHFCCARISMFSLEIKVEAFMTKDSDGKKSYYKERLLNGLWR